MEAVEVFSDVFRVGFFRNEINIGVIGFVVIYISLQFLFIAFVAKVFVFVFHYAHLTNLVLISHNEYTSLIIIFWCSGLELNQ